MLRKESSMKKVIVIIVAVLILVGGIFGAYKYIQIKHSKELLETT